MWDSLVWVWAGVYIVCERVWCVFWGSLSVLCVGQFGVGLEE